MLESPAQWFQVDGTAAEHYYPTDGKGGVTATSTSNATAGARQCIIYGILLIKSHSGATTIGIGTDDAANGGTSLVTLNIAASQAVPLYIQLGNELGIGINGPVMGTTSHTDTEFLVFYQKLF